MTPAPTITIAIPYYAGRSYLAEAIDSVRAQTVSDWRLLVVDDAGPDPAGDLVAAYADDRIEYVRNPVNRGLAGNWNECVRRASTDLVALLHGDDRLAPGYIAAVTAAATANDVATAVFTDPIVIGADGRRTHSLPDTVKRLARRPRSDHLVEGDRDLASILANNYVFCPTLCFRRAAVGDQPFEERWKMVMDLELVARLLLRGDSLAAVRSPLYEYRRHSGNQTNVLTSSAVRFEEELALYREVAERASAQGWQRTARAARHRSMVRAHLARGAGLDLVAGRRDAARTKAALLRNDLRRARPS